MVYKRLKLLVICVALSVFMTSLAGSTPLRPSVVTTSPQITELVAQLGKFEYIAAGSPVPGTPLSLPALGTLALPSLERVVAVDSDWLVLDLEAVPSYLANRFKAHSKNTFSFQIRSPEDLLVQSAKLLSQVFETAANRSWISANDCLKKIPRVPEFKFLSVVWLEPVAVFGKHTFFAKLVERVGGKNLAPETPWNTYPTVSEEWLLGHAPDLIYLFSDIPNGRELLQRKMEYWWPRSQVKVVVLNADHFARSNFTPIKSLKELNLPIELPNECQF